MSHVANTNVSEIKLPNVYFSICEIGIKRDAIDNESEMGMNFNKITKKIKSKQKFMISRVKIGSRISSSFCTAKNKLCIRCIEIDLNQ